MNVTGHNETSAQEPLLPTTTGPPPRSSSTHHDDTSSNTLALNGSDGVLLQEEHTCEHDEQASISTFYQEEQVALVVMRILGEPYASTCQFWFQTWPVAALLGIVVGLATLCFLTCIHFFMGLWFTFDNGGELTTPVSNWKWVCITTIGGFLSGLVLLLPGAPKLGTTRTMFHDAVDLTGHPMHTFFLTLSSLCCLACGAPMGPEAAVGSIGSGLAALLSNTILKNDTDQQQQRRTRAAWVMCGLAASLGGLFPSPLLGVVIVHELSVAARPYNIPLNSVVASNNSHRVARGEDHDFMEQIFLAATAATMAYCTTRLVLPSFSFNNSLSFQNGDFELWHLAAAIPLGVCCGLIGALVLILNGLCRSIRQGTCRFLEQRLSCPPWFGRLLFPTLAGLLYGVAAVHNPLIVGTGIKFIKPLLEKSLVLKTHVLVQTALIKAFTMAVCLGFGLVGGPVFPLVFVGTCVGLAFSSIAPIAIPCCMSAVPGSFVAIPFTLVFFISMSLGLTPEHVGPVFVATVVSYTVVGGLGIVKQLGLKRLGVVEQPLIQGLDRQESFAGQDVPPNDDDVLRNIRTVIFGT